MAGVERGPVVGSAPSKCVGCPFAGLCTPCKPLSVKGESGYGEKLVFKGGFEELLSLPKLPNFIDPKLIDFSSARGKGGEPPTSEKNCSICQKEASDCGHSKTKI